MPSTKVAQAVLAEAYRAVTFAKVVEIAPVVCYAASSLSHSRGIHQGAQTLHSALIRPWTYDGLCPGAEDKASHQRPVSVPQAAAPHRPIQSFILPGSGAGLVSFPWATSCQPFIRAIHTSSSLQADVEVKVPPMGESITEGTVAAVLVKEGDPLKEDDIVAQIETDKVTVDVKYVAKEPGVVKKLLINEQDSVTVGQSVVVVEQGEAAAAAAAAAASSPDTPVTVQEVVNTPAAPPPKAAAPKPAPPQPEAPASPAASQPPPGASQRPVRRVKMTRLRLRVAERLKGAQNTYAMLTTFNEVDMTNLMSLRNEFKDIFYEKHGVKLGFMSAFVKATASALREVPAVNGVIDGTDILYRDYVDISIAVATPKGLVVPVIRNADELSFADVERTMNSLAKKARDGSISIDEMAGGTFTISNGGVYGSMLSTPIINPPQSAILGMHNIQKRAWVVGDKIEPRPIMYIALTYDHRLIDGREAVTFLKRVKEVVEDPRRLLLDV